MSSGRAPTSRRRFGISFLWAALFAAFAASSSAVAAVPALPVVSPAAGATVNGTVTFAASAGGPANLASVEFALGSKKLGVATASPFAVSWNTGYASDGTYTLQATARDAIGNVVAAGEQTFVINNHGNSLAVSSPDLSGALSGTVNLVINGSDSQYFPAVWMVNVDGEDQADFWTDTSYLGGRNPNTVTIPLDTTAFPNGRHELYIAMHSNFWQATSPSQVSWHDWRGGFERVVDVENGHSLMDIAANYLHVYLQPGGQLALTCSQLFTDLTSGPCASPSYSSSDPATVSVSSAGMLSAGANEGFATVTVSDSGKQTYVRVWVKNSSNVPHFSGNGQMLNSYQAGASLFVVAPFVLQPSNLEADPNLLAATQLAGINTLSRGFYMNPRSITYDYNSWQQFYDNNIEPDWQFAANNGFHILATGDDLARGIGSEAWWTLNWPSGQAAVQYAMQKLAASGVAVAADIVDESSMLWGPTPKPPGQVGAPGSFTSVSCSGGTCTVSWPDNPVTPSRFPVGTSFALAGSLNSSLNTPPGQMFTATNITSDSFDFAPAGSVTGVFNASNDPGLEFLWWAGNIGGCPSQPCDPPVPNNALTTITSWLRTAPSAVPISWPALGVAPPEVHANWMGPNGISDYASEYWDSIKLRHTYTWSSGIQEWSYWMRDAFYSRQPLMMIDRPQLLLDSISAPDYFKNTPGGAYYNPPTDSLNQPGVTASVITSSIMTAAALGAAGVRLYQFDTPSQVYIRMNAPLGTELQTGASPSANDPVATSNWQAISYAANPLTKTLSPYVLGTAMNSPAYGRNIVTAVRQAGNGRMLMIVNDNDWDRTITVDFTPYVSGGPIVRYRISSDGIGTALLPNSSSGETIDLAAGESAVYLFESRQYVGTPKRVRIGAPKSGVGRSVLHYSYIYQSLPRQQRGIDCTKGCTLALDQNLGDVYYRFTYLGRHRQVRGRSVTRVIRATKGPARGGRE